MTLPLYAKFYAVVRKIPRGRVATYGQIARLAGLPRHARHVGYALAACEEKDVPWQRVINSKGEVSFRGDALFSMKQRGLLEKEGVRFSAKGRVSFERYGWRR